MKANETHKEAINHLNKLVNSVSGAAWVPLRVADHVRGAAAAIGLHVCTGMIVPEKSEAVIYID